MMNWYSETERLRERREAGLHPIDELRRFRAFVCCLFCGICVSLIYAFDLFTTEFKNSFGLSAGDLSTISTVGLVFCYATLPYGILYEYFGPLPLFILATITGVLGSMLLVLAFEGRVPGNTVTLSIFYALLNTCSGLFDVASIVTLCELFPRNRGPVVGLAKVMAGLGSSVLATLSTSFFDGDVSGFIIFILFFCIAVGVASVVLIALPPYYVNGWRKRGKTPGEIAAFQALKPLYERKFVPVRRLAVGFAVVGALLVFITVAAPVAAYTTVSAGGQTVIGVVAVVLVLSFGLMAAPIRALGGVDEPAPADEGVVEEAGPAAVSPGKGMQLALGEVVDGPGHNVLPGSGGGGCALAEESFTEMALATSETGVDDAAAAEEEEGEDEEEEGTQDARYPGGVRENLRRLDIWLILFGFTCQTALGTIVMYNGTTISVALAGKARDAGTGALYTAFLGVGSSAGRIAMGLFEAYTQHKRPGKWRLPVTAALPVAPALETVAGVLILVLPPGAILFPYILIYFGEGIFASVCALIFPCLFEKGHGVYYNMSFLSTVVAVILFNRVLFGVFIDHKLNALGLDKEDEAAECNVRGCVVVPLAVATALTAVGAVAQFLVHIRYTRFLRRVADAAPHSAMATETEADGSSDGGGVELIEAAPLPREGSRPAHREPLEDRR